MKYFIFSDIHSNLEALTAVLAIHTSEKIMILGDVIGYGPDPKACIEVIQGLASPCLIGNHEAVQLDLSELNNFNSLARESAKYTRSSLTPQDLAWIRSLPREIIDGQLYFSHGSAYDPAGFHYLMPQDIHSSHLRLSFSKLAKLGSSVGFYGHTHLPGYFTESSAQITFTPLTAGTEVALDQTKRYIINCGSVGQPRNNDCNAQFIVFDTETWTVSMKSVAYEIEQTAQKMQAAKLPEQLWKRLFLGI